LLFGTSGIRGIVGEEVTQDLCESTGRALGTMLGPGTRVCIGRDSRNSGPRLLHWVGDGLSTSGCTAVDAGVLPTPALAAVTRKGSYDAGVMLTASHNPYPPEYNGIKLFGPDGLGFNRRQEHFIESLCASRDFASGQGSLERITDAFDIYMRTIPADLAAAAASSPLKLMLDPGNGAAAGFATNLFRALDIPVVSVNDTPDGTFPGRGPEPAEHTLESTHRALLASDADLAACFDGDADRVVFIDREGFIGLDAMAAFVSHLRVSRTGRRIVCTTVETGRLIDLAIRPLDGVVVRGEVGDVPVAHSVLVRSGALGVETVGVYIFPEHGLYPESMLATLHVLASGATTGDIRSFINALPALHLHKVKVPCPNAIKQRVMDSLDVSRLVPLDEVVCSMNMTDGVRLELHDCWMLVRPSGTEPVVRVSVECAERCRACNLADHAADVVRKLVTGLADETTAHGEAR